MKADVEERVVAGRIVLLGGGSSESLSTGTNSDCSTTGELSQPGPLWLRYPMGEALGLAVEGAASWVMAICSVYHPSGGWPR